jgi:hypothetical protein
MLRNLFGDAADTVLAGLSMTASRATGSSSMRI